MHCAVKAILACSIGCTDLTQQVLVNSTELLLVRPKRLGVLNQRGTTSSIQLRLVESA